MRKHLVDSRTDRRGVPARERGRAGKTPVGWMGEGDSGVSEAPTPNRYIETWRLILDAGSQPWHMRWRASVAAE